MGRTVYIHNPIIFEHIPKGIKIYNNACYVSVIQNWDALINQNWLFSFLQQPIQILTVAGG